MGLDLGHRSLDDSRVPTARPHPIGLAAVPVTEVSYAKEPAEAAHVPSRHRTEPMRCRLPITSLPRSRFRGECSRRSNAARKGSSSPSCLACTWHGEVSGTLRLKIPPEGVMRQGRGCMGTCKRLIPYSCLVPPRFLDRRVDAVARTIPAQTSTTLERAKQTRS